MQISVMGCGGNFTVRITAVGNLCISAGSIWSDKKRYVAVLGWVPGQLISISDKPS